METVGTRIRALRAQRGWSQAQLAGYAGLPARSTIAKYELGTLMPSDRVLAALADLFCVTPEFLRHGDSEKCLPAKQSSANTFRINGRPKERCSALLYPTTLARVKSVAKQNGITVAEALDQIVEFAIKNLAN